MAEQRFITLTDVGEILNISPSQTRALVRSGELPAIQIGGRNQWRIEKSKLEEYIQERYRLTQVHLQQLEAVEEEESPASS
ncbi:MAG: helix-turn-helix domain-containing protein [Rothia sp. (in: high G+C Gram-positive bacteria)]|nr:helix-turn-helix domain-containing protein [Rothia sp. (in: high G+C Gram-positive bacteria)]